MDNPIKKYKFKYARHDIKDLAIFFIASIIFAFVYFETEHITSRAIRDVFGNREIFNILLSTIVEVAFAVGSLLLLWRIISPFTLSFVYAEMHENHLKMNLNGEEHIIRYSEIRDIPEIWSPYVHGYGLRLVNGSEIKIFIPISYGIRNVITIYRFIHALEKKIKNRKR